MRSAPMDRLKPLIPLGAGVALILATWFGWNAFAQWRDEAGRDSVQEARDKIGRAHV